MYSSCPSVLQVNGPWGEDACTHVSWILHTRARSSHCAGPRDALTPRSLQASLPHLLALYGHRPARHSVHRCCRRLRPRRQSGRCRASLRCIRSCASEIRVSRADETVTSVVALWHAVRVSTLKGTGSMARSSWLRVTCCAVLCTVRVSAFCILPASVPCARTRSTAMAITMADTAAVSLPRPVKNEELEQKARAYFATGNKVCMQNTPSQCPLCARTEIRGRSHVYVVCVLKFGHGSATLQCR